MPTKTPRLILRTARADMTSYGGFVWPTEGKVAAPDWHPKPECGGGLHGLLNGQGDAYVLDWDIDAKWIVAKPGRLLVDLDGKVKCKSATVVYCGDRAGALATLRQAGVTDPLPGDEVSGGHWSTVSGGHESTVSGGHESTVSVNYHDGHRYRIAVAYPGEDGINADTPYRVNDLGEFVEVAS